MEFSEFSSLMAEHGWKFAVVCAACVGVGAGVGSKDFPGRPVKEEALQVCAIFGLMATITVVFLRNFDPGTILALQTCWLVAFYLMSCLDIEKAPVKAVEALNEKGQANSKPEA